MHCLFATCMVYASQLPRLPTCNGEKLAGSCYFSMPLTTDSNDLYQWLYSGCLLFPFPTETRPSVSPYTPFSFSYGLPTVQYNDSAIFLLSFPPPPPSLYLLSSWYRVFQRNWSPPSFEMRLSRSNVLRERCKGMLQGSF